MARSGAYDEWEDVGLAFTEEQAQSFDPQALAETHLRYLCDNLRILERRAQLPDVSKPVWFQQAAKRLKSRITWLAVAASLPSVDVAAVCELPDPKSAEGKELTKRAQMMEPEPWLGQMQADCNAHLTQLVTLGRRAATVQKWGKAQHSRSNKIANALHGDLNTSKILEELLQSLPKPKK